MELPFVGPSYHLESRPSGVQRTINMVPVPEEPGNERTAWVFKDVPGLVAVIAPPIPPLPPCLEGPIWTQRVIQNFRWDAIGYGAGIFVAGGADTVGITTVVARSIDNGVTWVIASTPPVFLGIGVANAKAMTFGNGVFSMRNNTQEGATSSDGNVWTHHNSAYNFACTYMYFANGFFYSVSVNEATVQRCADGFSWAQVTLPANRQWAAGAYCGSGIHVIISAQNAPSARSVDNGVTWVAGGTTPVNFGADMAFGNGVVVALSFGGGDNRIIRSIDNGVTWSSALAVLPSLQSWLNIIFVQGVFLATANGGPMAVSVDGLTWTALVVPNRLPTAMTGAPDLAFDDAGHYAAIHSPGSPTAVAASGVC